MFQTAAELLNQQVDKGLFYGYALTVGRREEPLFQASYGRLGTADKTPPTDQTCYDVGSLTEVMVTVPLTLLAVEKGLVSLTDPIARYLNTPMDKRSITLLQLLTHTSGMKSNFLLEQAAEGPLDALQAALSYPLSALPGKRTRHSTIGYIVLGKLLEQVYGLPLDEAAKKYIFTPLGLKNTGYLPAGERVAQSDMDEATGEPRTGESGDANARFLHGVAAHAGLFSSAADEGRFLSMLSAKGRLNGNAFLTKESVSLMTQDHTQGLKEPRGLGFQLASRTATFMGDLWPKEGFGQAAASGPSLAVEPSSGLYVVLLANRTPKELADDDLLRLRRLVHNSIFAEFSRLGE